MIASTSARPTGASVFADRIGLLHSSVTPFSVHRASIVCLASKKEDNKTSDDVGMGLKSIWIAAEGFGNLLGAMRSSSSSSSSSAAAPGERQQPASPSGRESPLSRDDAIASLRADYDANYFVSGAGDLDAYDPDCRFADPFASFRGVERFKRNVSNLGGMLRDVKLDISEWEQEGDTLRTKWKFSGILDLPWKPRLAASGGTTHVFDPITGRVVDHIESWDVSPGDVVRTLLKPSSKVPTSQWDVLMNSVYAGDLKGIWLATSLGTIKFSGGVLGASLVSKAITGDWLPGTWFFFAALIAGGITEVVKIATGMQGGET